MAKKIKKVSLRNPVAKRKSKTKPAMRLLKKRVVKKLIRRKKPAAKRRETTLEKIENAILVGAAEMDDVAIGLGLLAASAPPPKPRKKSRG